MINRAGVQPARISQRQKTLEKALRKGRIANSALYGLTGPSSETFCVLRIVRIGLFQRR